MRCKKVASCAVMVSCVCPAIVCNTTSAEGFNINNQGIGHILGSIIGRIFGVWLSLTEGHINSFYNSISNSIFGVNQSNYWYKGRVGYAYIVPAVGAVVLGEVGSYLGGYVGENVEKAIIWLLNKLGI